MSIPFNEKCGLISRNNEAILKKITLTEEIDGIKIPIDISEFSFFSQARKSKLPTSPLICNITVELTGNPGEIVLTVSDTVIKNLKPVRGFYDILFKVNSLSVARNLYLAPFIIEGGVSNRTEFV